jgi:hypothetical protein
MVLASSAGFFGFPLTIDAGTDVPVTIPDHSSRLTSANADGPPPPAAAN